MAFLLAADAISGKEGAIFATIDGQVRECAEIKSFTANFNKTKSEFRALGYRGTQHKATGWTGTGSVSFYYVTTEWTKLLFQYARTGVDSYFDMVVVNHDPGSAIQTQRIQLIDCNLDGGEIAKIDVDADWLDGSFNFTFSNWAILEEFSPFRL